MAMPNPESIISNLKDYLTFRDRNSGFTLSGYAWLKLTPDVLVATISILWPKFIMHSGGCFIEESFSQEIFGQWMVHCGGNINEVERIMNHRHVRQLIQDQDELTERLIRFIGEAVVCFWEAAIHSQFPNLSIVVTSEWDAEDNDVVISVSQKCGGEIQKTT
jgi:hypothetical protein